MASVYSEDALITVICLLACLTWTQEEESPCARYRIYDPVRTISRDECESVIKILRERAKKLFSDEIIFEIKENDRIVAQAKKKFAEDSLIGGQLSVHVLPDPEFILKMTGAVEGYREVAVSKDCTLDGELRGRDRLHIPIEPVFSSKSIRSATLSPESKDRLYPELQMALDEEASKRLAEISKMLAGQGLLAFVIDDRLRWAVRMMTPITEGKISLTGVSTSELRILEIQLNHPLPFILKRDDKPEAEPKTVKPGPVARAKITSCEAFLQQVKMALDLYYMDKAQYPSSGNVNLVHEISMGELVYLKITAKMLNGKKELVDPWGNPFSFRNNQEAVGDTGGPIHNEGEFDIYSFGPNGEDEKGEGDDIGNWKK